MNISNELADEIIGYLMYACERGWDHYTDNYIVPKGSYTPEQELEKGDSWAYGLMNQLKELKNSSKESFFTSNLSASIVVPV